MKHNIKAGGINNMLNLSNNIKVHNKFEARLYCPEGRLKQEALAENIVLDNFWNSLFTSDGSTFRGIRVGTGTSEPVGSNKELESPLGGYIARESDSVERETILNESIRSSTLKFKAIAPANLDFVGDISEIGCYSGSRESDIITRALFRDSEGQPISISKTENDNLVIDVTIYLNVIYADPIVPTSYNDIFTSLIIYENNAYNIDWGRFAFLSSLNYTIDNSRFATHTTSGLIGSTSYGSVIKDDRKIIHSKKRHSDTEGNNLFANFVNIPNVGYIKLPNEDIIPSYSVEDIDVGVGDGSSVTFVCPIPEFIEGTETIKIDGVSLSRGDDYELSHKNNSVMSASSAKSSILPHNFLNTRGEYAERGLLMMYSSTDETAILTYDEPVSFEGIYIPNMNMGGWIRVDISDDLETWVNIFEVSSAHDNLGWNKINEYEATKYYRVSARESQPSNDPIWLGDEPTEGIIFTTPPANGAKITISCTVDRPFKTEEFVFDTSYELSY